MERLLDLKRYMYCHMKLIYNVNTTCYFLFVSVTNSINCALGMVADALLLINILSVFHWFAQQS